MLHKMHLTGPDETIFISLEIGSPKENRSVYLLFQAPYFAFYQISAAVVALELQNEVCAVNN